MQSSVGLWNSTSLTQVNEHESKVSQKVSQKGSTIEIIANDGSVWKPHFATLRAASTRGSSGVGLAPTGVWLLGSVGVLADSL